MQVRCRSGNGHTLATVCEVALGLLAFPDFTEHELEIIFFVVYGLKLLGLYEGVLSVP
jgi:hypothetical protein